MRDLTTYFKRDNSTETQSNSESEKLNRIPSRRRKIHGETCDSDNENSTFFSSPKDIKRNKKRKSLNTSNISATIVAKRKSTVIQSDDSDFDDDQNTRTKISRQRSLKFRQRGRTGIISKDSDLDDSNQKNGLQSMRTLKNVLVKDCMNPPQQNDITESNLNKKIENDSDTDNSRHASIECVAQKTKIQNSLFNYFSKADNIFHKDGPKVDDSPINCLKKIKVVVQVHSPPKASLKLIDRLDIKENLYPRVNLIRADVVKSLNFDDITVIRSESAINGENAIIQQNTWKMENNIASTDIDCSVTFMKPRKASNSCMLDSEKNINPLKFNEENVSKNKNDNKCFDPISKSFLNEECSSLCETKNPCNVVEPSQVANESSSSLKHEQPWKMRVQFASGAKLRTVKKPQTDVCNPVSQEEGLLPSDRKVIGVVLNKISCSSLTAQNSEIKKPRCVKDDAEKPQKLAPLFCKQYDLKKTKISDENMESRKIFLRSGLPEVILKRIDEQRNTIEDMYSEYIFPKNSHIQQKTNSFVWGLENVDFKMKHFTDFVIHHEDDSFSLPVYKNVEPVRVIKYIKDFSFENEVAALKISVPDVNVADLCSSVKRLNEIGKNIDDICWTDKYRPVTCNDIIGNKNSIMRLKEWIESHKRIKIRHSDGDGSSEEFINSDDSDHEESRKNNVAILVGPPGCGKTCAVYMLANELDYKVLEVNAASNRNGKRLLDELLEATQSHRVRRVPSFNKHAQKAKKKKRKTISQEKKAMSLILIEDADILFENHDEGFLSALSSLVIQSKRPLIFIVNDIKLPHLLKYNNAKNLVLNFSYPSRSLVNVWLQLIALIEGVKLSDHVMMDLFEEAKLDLRKSLLQLQLLISSKIRFSKLDGERLFYNKWYANIASVRKQCQANISLVTREVNDLFSPSKEIEVAQNTKKDIKYMSNEPDWKTNRLLLEKCMKFSENVALLGLMKNKSEEITFCQIKDHVLCFSNEFSFQLNNDIHSFLKNNLFFKHIDTDTSFSFAQYYNVVRKNLKIESVHRNTLTHLKFGSGDSYSKFCDYLPIIRNITRMDQEKQHGNLRRSNRYFSYLKSNVLPCDGIHTGDSIFVLAYNKSMLSITHELLASYSYLHTSK